MTLLAGIGQAFHLVFSPYELGASLRTPEMTPLPNPPLGVSGSSDYQGLVHLVGEPAAKGFLRLFGSSSAPWPFWRGLEERGSYLVVTELKREMAEAREGKNENRRVVDYLLANATREQREATIERGLRAMMERRGIEVARYVEEAIEREVGLVESWIEDPDNFFKPTPSADAIVELVMARMLDLPDAEALEDLESQILDYFVETLKAEYVGAQQVQEKVWQAYQNPLVIISHLFPGGRRNCTGLANAHFLGGEIGVLSDYGLIMEHFIRFHEAIHVGDRYPVELMDWMFTGLTFGLFKGSKSFQGLGKRLSAWSEQKARYYDWQLAQKFFRGHEELILHQALALQLDPDTQDPDKAARVTALYFGELMAMADASLFDYLLNSLTQYDHLGIIQDPENRSLPTQRHQAGEHVFTEGGFFMASAETAKHLEGVMTPGAEILYVTADRRGTPKYRMFKVPPK